MLALALEIIFFGSVAENSVDAFVSLNPSNFSRKLEKKIDSIVAPLCDSNGGGAKALLQCCFVVFGSRCPLWTRPVAARSADVGTLERRCWTSDVKLAGSLSNKIVTNIY